MSERVKNSFQRHVRFSLPLMLLMLLAGPSMADKKPNFILVLTDDQGWIDTSVPMMAGRSDTASPFIRTPYLKRLAARGLVFANAYSPAPTCTPSRSSIQFGKTPARLRQTVVHDVLAKQRGIDCRDEISIAQMIKANDPDYVTAHFGKWGFPPRSPEDAGYDATDGNTNNGDGDYIDVKTREPLPEDDPKRIFSLTNRANAFISKQAKAGRPFFLQISHYAVHVQHSARAATVKALRMRPASGRITERDFANPAPRQNASGLLYAAMIEDLDASLGLLLDHLGALGIAGNTYVIFTSDNGGGFRANGPLRGGKATVWEGGLRVPMVVTGPGVVKGAYCNTPVAGWDLWSTIHDLTSDGKPLPSEVDGASLRPLLERGNDGVIRRADDALIFHFPWYAGHPMTAIRRGDFKLIRSLNTREMRLFDLSKDLGEEHDIAAKRPELAKELNGALSDYLARVDAETIEEMRAARRRELHKYLQREQAEIGELKRQLASVGPADPAGLKEKLNQVKRRIAAHKHGLQQVQQSEQDTAW